MDLLEILASAANNTYIKILKANLTTDTFSVIKDDEQNEKGLSQKVDKISEYLTAFVDHNLIHKDDIVDFERVANITYLSDYFKKHHQDIFWMIYRRKTAAGYGQANMEIITAEDYTDENQSLYLFVKDISAALDGVVNVQDEYKALCENYEFICNLDLRSKKVILYRFPDKRFELEDYGKETGLDYKEMIDRTISRSVIRDDQENVRRGTELSFVEEQLRHSRSYSLEARAKIHNEIQWYRITYSRIEKESVGPNIAIGLSDISNEKRATRDLYRNSKTILIVEKEQEDRKILQEILEEKYRLICTDSGSEALEILKEKHEDIATIITDLSLPEMDEYRMLKQIRINNNFSSIPVIVFAKLSELEKQEECLLHGASDVIFKPYNQAIIKNRVDFMIQYRESSNIIRIVEKDPLTGLFTKEFFYRYASEIIEENPRRKYAVVVSDIQGFRVFNERYGTSEGDKLLRELSEKGTTCINGVVLAGRIDGGMFAALLEETSFDDWSYEGIHKELLKQNWTFSTKNVILKTGIYIQEMELPISIMCDRAKMAMESIKGVFGVNCAYYDENLRKKLEFRHILEEGAQTALEEKQFQVFYQPKHCLESDQTGGAEALVRWAHPEFGFINPGEFIPVFEKSGFIAKMDEYVFKQVCDDLCRWKKSGMPLLPISVNLSRRDFEETLADDLIRYIEKCKIDASLIHLEVTESAFSENQKAISRAIERLHQYGFEIELDDFGAGYSSMTTLNSMDIDTLKIDMSIVQNDMPGSKRNVLDFCVNMAKTMAMKTVVEGVETLDQVERLKDLGCDYIQGYFYSKPLPVNQFEKYLKEEKQRVDQKRTE